jgi:ATP-dependent DNA helicase RecG
MPIPASIESILSGKIVEQQRIEYKTGWDPKEVLHSICAFANDFDDFGGGYIILGVKAEDGVPESYPGIPDDKLDSVEGEILEYSKRCLSPDYLPSMEVVQKEGKNLIVIWAFSGEQRPYLCLEDVYGKGSGKRESYIRSLSSTIKASESQKKTLQRLAEDIGFDERINYKAQLLDIDVSLVKEYLHDTGSDLLSVSSEPSLNDLAEDLRIIGGPKEDLRPKNVGLLLFSPRPDKFIPYSYIQIDYVPDPTGKGMREKPVYGPIQKQLSSALEYIRNTYLDTRIVKQEGIAESLSIDNYPYQALEELLSNAVLHKDYRIPEPITVRITAEDIEITSFPGVDQAISDEDIASLKMRTRRYRNKRIGEFLKELHLVEAKNTGIPTAIEAMKANGSPSIRFENGPDREYVVCYIPIHPIFLEKKAKDDTKNLQKKKLAERILDSLAESPKILSALAKDLNMPRTDGSLRYNLKKLKEKGLIFIDSLGRYAMEKDAK